MAILKSYTLKSSKWHELGVSDLGEKENPVTAFNVLERKITVNKLKEIMKTEPSRTPAEEGEIADSIQDHV